MNPLLPTPPTSEHNCKLSTFQPPCTAAELLAPVCGCSCLSLSHSPRQPARLHRPAGRVCCLHGRPTFRRARTAHQRPHPRTNSTRPASSSRQSAVEVRAAASAACTSGAACCSPATLHSRCVCVCVCVDVGVSVGVGRGKGGAGVSASVGLVRKQGRKVVDRTGIEAFHALIQERYDIVLIYQDFFRCINVHNRGSGQRHIA